MILVLVICAAVMILVLGMASQARINMDGQEVYRQLEEVESVEIDTTTTSTTSTRGNGQRRRKKLKTRSAPPRLNI